MKTLAFILLSATLIFSCKNANTPAETSTETSKPKTDSVAKPPPVVQYDTVEAKDIWVQNKPIINTPVRDLQHLLKTADSVTHGTITEFGYNYTEYNLKGTVIRYHDSVFANLIMRDNILTFSIAGHGIKVGDDQSLLKAMFPKPFAERDSSTVAKQHNSIVYVLVRHANIELHFLLNPQGTIIGIEIMTVLDA